MNQQNQRNSIGGAGMGRYYNKIINTLWINANTNAPVVYLERKVKYYYNMHTHVRWTTKRITRVWSLMIIIIITKYFFRLIRCLLNTT